MITCIIQLSREPWIYLCIFKAPAFSACMPHWVLHWTRWGPLFLNPHLIQEQRTPFDLSPWDESNGGSLVGGQHCPPTKKSVCLFWPQKPFGFWGLRNTSWMHQEVFHPFNPVFNRIEGYHWNHLIEAVPMVCIMCRGVIALPAFLRIKEKMRKIRRKKKKSPWEFFFFCPELAKKKGNCPEMAKKKAFSGQFMTFELELPWIG